jgi:hypothetical protein
MGSGSGYERAGATVCLRAPNLHDLISAFWAATRHLASPALGRGPALRCSLQ